VRAVLYARCSTKGPEQDPAVQLHALRPWADRRGWTIVAEHSDRITGDPARRKGDPPGLRRALELIEQRKADVLAVFAADRLVRSGPALLHLVARVQSLGGHVASLQDGSDLDTTTDAGELLLFIKGWYSRMELKLIRARINAGLASARARGVRLGRPRNEHPAPEQVHALRQAGHSWATVAAVLDCSVSLARKRAAEVPS
jgi:DNA invertase Pin-like site-specific DNA recombinase